MDELQEFIDELWCVGAPPHSGDAHGPVRP